MRTALFLLLCPALHAQVTSAQSWVTVTVPNTVVVVGTTPITVRYGVAADNKWTSPMVFAAGKVFTVNGTTFYPDPDKTGDHVMQVLQTTGSQNITVGVPTAFTVPPIGSTAVANSGNFSTVKFGWDITVNTKDGTYKSATCTAVPQ